jgi:hypothetical protein
METLAFNSDFNSIGSFVVHVIFGAVAGGLFAMLYWQRSIRQTRTGWSTRPQSRRPAFNLALGVFLVPTAMFALWAYYSYLTPFFAARLSAADITFEYRFPERLVTVRRQDIEQVVKDLGSERGPWVHLVVYTKDGRRFESVPIKAERFEGLKFRIKPAEREASRAENGSAQ